jgi:diadenosine tetraphosphate (Ap4A) HIT family hydrolase
MTTSTCYACRQEDQFDDLPPRERIVADRHWRAAHALNTALPGWLVLLPRRHVTAVHELTDAEAEALGRWQVRLSRALHSATGCTKTYVAQFAEKEGFTHVHFHVVPRMADLPSDLRGPGVFEFLRQPQQQWLTADQADDISRSLQAQLSRRDSVCRRD